METSDESLTGHDSKKNDVILKHAYFAGGCFWCTEHDLKHVNGVKNVISGYAGGDFENPSYEDICTGRTGHRESVMISYDPEEVSYKTLMDEFLKTIDPLDSGGQFFDRGFQYTNAVFYENDNEKNTALESLQKAAVKLGVETLLVSVLPFKNFYKAENYHQGFSETNPVRYCSYRNSSGRDNKLKIIWNASQ